MSVGTDNIDRSAPQLSQPPGQSAKELPQIGVEAGRIWSSPPSEEAGKNDEKMVGLTENINPSQWTNIKESIGAKISWLGEGLKALAQTVWEAVKFCLYCRFDYEEQEDMESVSSPKTQEFSDKTQNGVQITQESVSAHQAVQEMLEGKGIDTSTITVQKMDKEGTLSFEVLKQFEKDVSRSEYRINNENKTPVDDRFRLSFRCDFYQSLQNQFKNENIFKNLSYLLTQAAVATFIKNAEDKGGGGATCDTDCEYSINQLKDKDDQTVDFYQLTVVTHLIINEKDENGIIKIDDETDKPIVKNYVSVKREILISKKDMETNWEDSSSGHDLISGKDKHLLAPEILKQLISEDTGGGSLQVVDTYFIGKDAEMIKQQVKNRPSDLLQPPTF